MAAFPTLKTGAVAQYPAQRRITYNTQVIEFIDGSEQRFREYPAPLRRWLIRLDRLDDGELQAVRNFFDQASPASPFSFVDPWDNSAYASCSIEGGSLDLEFTSAGRTRTELIIRENRA
ncbi:MAG: DUF2460 domain-containing protein [Acidobacteria bacterium]|nr:DUF2460 domain-containing protein [Acidobacteriota bacterium]